jgi:hypothetical protein
MTKLASQLVRAALRDEGVLGKKRAARVTETPTTQAIEQKGGSQKRAHLSNRSVAHEADRAAEDARYRG